MLYEWMIKTLRRKPGDLESMDPQSPHVRVLLEDGFIITSSQEVLEFEDRFDVVRNKHTVTVPPRRRAKARRQDNCMRCFEPVQTKCIGGDWQLVDSDGTPHKCLTR